MSITSPHHGSRPSADGGRRGLYGEVVNALGRRIVAGRLEAGAVIVPDQMSEKFGVSRSVVREALRALEAKGLLFARPGLGTTVRPPVNWSMTDPDIVEWRLSGPEQRTQERELQELREGLLPMVAGMVAGSIDDEAYRELDKALADMNQAVKEADGIAYGEADRRYHDVLIRATNNRMVEYLANLTNASIGQPGSPTHLCLPPSAAAVDGHTALLRALVAGGASAAVTMARALGTAVHEQAESHEGGQHA